MLLVALRFVRAKDDRVVGALIARGSRPLVLARSACVIAATLLVCAYVFWFGGALNAPVLAVRVVDYLVGLAPALTSGVPNFVLFVVVPGALVFALGARPCELGLGRPTPGTGPAAAVCLAPFAIAWLVRVSSGALTPSPLGVAILHNALSNGFSEEFLFRGLWLGHARAFMRTDWALLIQAIAFALMHLGTSLHDEPNALGILANVIALNVPLGFILGLIALRSGSIWLPELIHMAYDTTRHVWAAHT